MFMVGPSMQRVNWELANIWLDLIPLTADKDQEFVQATLTEVRDEKGALLGVKRDHVKYAQMVGCYCIKGWGAIKGEHGVVNDKKEPLECTEEAINQFMLVDVAEAFVFNKVKGMALHVVEEVEAGKPDSASESAG